MRGDLFLNTTSSTIDQVPITTANIPLVTPNAKHNQNTPLIQLLWLSLRGLDQLLAEVPELLCQFVALSQFGRLLLIAVSKVFSCHSPQLWVQSYVTSSCCSLKNGFKSISICK